MGGAFASVVMLVYIAGFVVWMALGALFVLIEMLHHSRPRCLHTAALAVRFVYCPFCGRPLT